MSIIETTNAAADAVSGERSLKDVLLAAREEAQRDKTVDLEIPGYGGRLWGTFRALDDYTELRALVQRARDEGQDDMTRELYAGADTLVRACTDTYAREGEEKHPLGKRLGLELASYLGLDDADTDRQAVFLLVPSSLALMSLFADYDAWLKGTFQSAIGAAEGKSEGRA